MMKIVPFAAFLTPCSGIVRASEPVLPPGGAEENMANLRHIAINVLKNDSTKKCGIKGKQKNAPWDHFYLISLFWFPRLCP